MLQLFWLKVGDIRRSATILPEVVVALVDLYLML